MDPSAAVTAASRIADVNALPAVIAGTPTPPPAELVQRFNSLLAAPQATQSSAVSNGADLAGATAAPASRTLGDDILQGMAGISEDYRAKWNHLDNVVKDGSVSVANLLQFQGEMVQTGIRMQLVTTLVSKSGQGVDQLVKLQ